MINATTINTLKLSTHSVLYHKAIQNARGISTVCDTLLCSHTLPSHYNKRSLHMISQSHDREYSH